MLDLEGWSLINSEYALLTSVNRTLIFFFFYVVYPTALHPGALFQ